MGTVLSGERLTAEDSHSQTREEGHQTTAPPHPPTPPPVHGEGFLPPLFGISEVLSPQWLR